MSIRNALFLVFALLTACLASQAFIALKLSSSLEEASAAEERRHVSLALADELRQSSDDLTRLARTYAETGETRFKDCFESVLAIRGGTAARPRSYPGITWDEVSAGGAYPTDVGPAIPLEDLMRGQGFTAAEFEKLAEAKTLSDGLVTLENRAMNAMVGRFDGPQGPGTVSGAPDPALARALLHGAEYHRAKVLIMRPIEEATRLVSARTRRETDGLREDTRSLGRVSIGIALAALAFAVLSVLWLRRRVVLPVNELGDRLTDVVEGARDLTRRIEVRRRDEVGHLARQFNRFLAGLQDGLREAARASGSVAVVADDVAGAGRAQQQTAALLGASTQRIVAGVRQISDRATEIAGVAREVAEAVRASTADSTAGRQGLAEMNRTMEGLEQGTRSMGARLSSIAGLASTITGIVATMVTVTDRTNLLSVNAAVEAEKAGPHGRGFRVVAEEIRRLCDETAEATLQIEASVQSMQGAVESGVGEMRNFATQVDGSIATTGRVARQVAAVAVRVEGLGARFASLEEAVEEQSAGAGEIRDAASDLSRVAQESQQVAEAVGRSTEGLGQAVLALRGVIGQFRLEAGGSRGEPRADGKGAAS